MKKLYLASALATVLTLSSNAMAIDSTGCGLGSMAWRGQSGTAPQILAVTTNGSFGTQTFGISSGTSGCDQNGRITGGTQRMVLNFLENNMSSMRLTLPAARAKPLIRWPALWKSTKVSWRPRFTTISPSFFRTTMLMRLKLL